MVVLLGVKSFPLPDEDETGSDRNGDGEGYETCNESCDTVHDDEAQNGRTCRARRLIDVPSLKTHKFKGALQALEQWVIWVAAVLDCFFHPSVCL